MDGVFTVAIVVASSAAGHSATEQAPHAPGHGLSLSASVASAAAAGVAVVGTVVVVGVVGVVVVVAVGEGMMDERWWRRAQAEQAALRAEEAEGSPLVGVVVAGRHLGDVSAAPCFCLSILCT